MLGVGEDSYQDTQNSSVANGANDQRPTFISPYEFRFKAYKNKTKQKTYTQTKTFPFYVSAANQCIAYHTPSQEPLT